MAHTFTALLVHAIFSTKDRAPMLTHDLRHRLFPYMGGIVRNLNGAALIINGVEDHVHVLASMPATLTLSDLMKELKGISSGWVNDTMGLPGRFGWQTGYAAFSVSKSLAETVRSYIAKQEEHHRRTTFQEEYLLFLHRHNIEYDPRFVFEGTFVA